MVAECAETNKLICSVVLKRFLRFQGTKSGMEKALTTRMELHSSQSLYQPLREANSMQQLPLHTHSHDLSHAVESLDVWNLVHSIGAQFQYHHSNFLFDLSTKL